MNLNRTTIALVASLSIFAATASYAAPIVLLEYNFSGANDAERLAPSFLVSGATASSIAIGAGYAHTFNPNSLGNPDPGLELRAASDSGHNALLNFPKQDDIHSSPPRSSLVCSQNARIIFGRFRRFVSAFLASEESSQRSLGEKFAKSTPLTFPHRYSIGLSSGA